MATYAVGDVQGCFEPLRCLVEQVRFNPSKDQLWFAGDLVNRGPDSLHTLRFAHSLGSSARVVLGNHDLHLLAIYRGHQPQREKDTLEQVINAPDCDELMAWLISQPLIHHDKSLGYTMVHAGIPPQFCLKKARKLAKEVEFVLRSTKADGFLRHMYGNEPAVWDDELAGYERLRCITNYFTRMRFCHEDGTLDLKNKKSADHPAPNTLPWFQHNKRKTRGDKILFGHWAALMGNVNLPNLYALDTGCVWGKRMTMIRLEDEKLYSCDC